MKFILNRMKESNLSMTSAAAGLYWEKNVPVSINDHSENLFCIFTRDSNDKEYI